MIVVFVLLFGFIGVVVLVKSIRKDMFGFELYEIVVLYCERNVMFFVI